VSAFNFYNYILFSPQTSIIVDVPEAATLSVKTVLENSVPTVQQVVESSPGVLESLKKPLTEIAQAEVFQAAVQVILQKRGGWFLVP